MPQRKAICCSVVSVVVCLVSKGTLSWTSSCQKWDKLNIVTCLLVAPWPPVSQGSALQLGLYCRNLRSGSSSVVSALPSPHKLQSQGIHYSSVCFMGIWLFVSRMLCGWEMLIYSSIRCGLHIWVNVWMEKAPPQTHRGGLREVRVCAELKTLVKIMKRFLSPRWSLYSSAFCRCLLSLAPCA